MAGSKTTNTAREVEMQMLADISQAKAAPDADLQFLVQLETMILNHLRSQFGQAAGAMDQAAGGGPPMGAPPGAPPGGPPMPPPDMSGPPGAMPGIPPGALAGIMGGGGPGGPPPPMPPGPPPGPPGP